MVESNMGYILSNYFFQGFLKHAPEAFCDQIPIVLAGRVLGLRREVLHGGILFMRERSKYEPTAGQLWHKSVV